MWIYFNYKSQNFVASAIDFPGIDDKIRAEDRQWFRRRKINQYDMICVDLAE
jgi:hypothetical protein